jgi:hypothetical protein
MFGLRNKLILCPRPNSSEESLLPRRVIIPQGKVYFGKDGNFTRVSINTSNEQHVHWHEYTIDTDLGCLRSNTSLSSKLYQCYLHALTSHCLPDPLLGHTGTEEALNMLRSAACRSFQRLDGHDAKLLELISNLTPDRVYYPEHRQSMAQVKWNDLPALSQHHDFYPVACSILDHARALEALYDQPAVFRIPDRRQLLLNRVAYRNKSYYPSDVQIPKQPSSLDDIEYRSRDDSDVGTTEYMAYRTSGSIWSAQPSLDRKLPNLWDLMKSWGSVGPAESDISLRYSRYWLDLDAARDWITIYDLCRKAVNGNSQNSRIDLSFCLSAAAYGESKYADIVPALMVFALDERCRNLNPPANSSYTLSDGVAPELTRLKNMVSGAALPMASTPARFLTYDTNQRYPEVLRKADYDATIFEKTSEVAGSILRQWPYYRSVHFREQWFDKNECLRCVDEYFQSISRNIQLRDHILQLQSILDDYGNDPTPITLPYIFSPQSTASYSSSKLPSYSICDVLLSRTNVPTPSADEPSLQTDNLKNLIEEFRHSGQPLLEHYGNELNKSHCELMSNSASQSARGVVPSHELLHLYHNECSHRKDKIFLQISATLAPSQNVEKANAVAGLWPRITPRSLLRQLAKDRIGTLPDQWKAEITRYSICILKYQQSQRMLELSSSQKHEELLREMDSMRSDVLVESTPDWLLVQVCPLHRRRSTLSRLR